MIRRALIVVLLIVAATSAAIAKVQSRRVAALKGELATAEAALRGYEAADAWRAKEAKRAAEAATLDRDLQEGEGADEPLSDYLRDAAGRVWQ